MSKKDKIDKLEARIRHLETESVWIEEVLDIERRTREAFQRLADVLDISLSELYETPRMK
tara:strand:+ start:471 stop:650 length:180 start_codon:yes stop_codon:yes gene_type:complete